MLIKCRAPGIAVASYPRHPAPTFSIKCLPLNIHEHHQWSFGHPLPATGLLLQMEQRIHILPVREGIADIDLKSVPDMLLYFLNKFGWGALPPENCLTHCHLFNFVSRDISSNVAFLNFKQWRCSSLHPDLLQESEPIYLASSFTDLLPGYGNRLSTFTVI